MWLNQNISHQGLGACNLDILMMYYSFDLRIVVSIYSMNKPSSSFKNGKLKFLLIVIIMGWDDKSIIRYDI